MGKMQEEQISKLIKSISYDQGEIIRNILKLHVPGGKIDCDPTYSKGVFYKNTWIEKPMYKYDIKPQDDEVEYADCRNLPLMDNTLNCIMFDPPFLASTGKSLTGDARNNVMLKRFGVYPDEKELHKFYIQSLTEFYRILKEHGILIFKCQDKVSSGKQYLSHVFIINEAVKMGFYPKDLFVLLAKSRIMSDWQLQNQRNSRKFHCYFIVFEKCNKVIEYT